MTNKPSFRRIVIAWAITAATATIVNNLYSLIHAGVSGFSVPKVINPISITLGSSIPILAGALVFFLISLFLSRPAVVFVPGSIILALLSIAGSLQPNLPDGSPTPDGFFWLSAPMHVIAGIVCAIGIPLLSKKEAKT